MIRDQVIWKKDDHFPLLGVNYRVEMDPSVVELPEKKIALYSSFNFMEPGGFVGWVHGVRLVENEIVGHLQFVSPNMENWYTEMREREDLLRLGGYYDDVEQSEIVDGVRNVLKSRLRAVAYVFDLPGFRSTPRITS